MKTATFCQEVESGVTKQQIDERVIEMKTLGGAIDAYAKTVGGKIYLCAVWKVFDEPLDDELNDPERAGSITSSPSTTGGDDTTKNMRHLSLTDLDYENAAARLDCKAAAIRAVAEVESGGRTGFLPDGRPKILFESHIFSKLTGGQYDRSHPDISTARWIRNYVGGAGEHDRLKEAMLLNREAAFKAASWGKFQILGLNYRLAGSKTIEEFVEAQNISEKEHLDAFVNFILSCDLSDELRELRWDDFARKYNGLGFAKNRYDEKMKQAYTSFT